MKHLGDITKINGAEVPTVEVIIGGSPCQDLSVAGKRAGLSGERSGLFMEQLRIIKEMRENDRRNGRTDELARPRFMVWENVLGAFSSNKGEDFRIVLEETARVADPTAVIPRPPKGKWTNAGAVVGDGWSLAWRVFDAQFWGVPQRRRRIALVADFGGGRAPEILFERKGMSGDITESREQGQKTATNARDGIDSTISFQERAGKPGGVKESSYSTTESAHSQLSTISACYGISAYESNAMKSGNPNSGVYLAETARTLDNNGGSPACNQGGMAIVQCYDARGNGDGDTAPTMTGDHQSRITDYTAIISLDRAAYNQGINAQYDIGVDDSGKSQTIVSKGPNAVCIGNGQPDQLGVSEKVGALNCMHDQQAVMIDTAIVRRLTPLECERLQGYPDGWTHIGDWIDSKGKKHRDADSPKYKALGNSIALPPWTYVLSRLNGYCTEHTMASLFDGIGGFPLIWERLNGKGTCLWASEIEEFPIAVTKIRFGQE